MKKLFILGSVFGVLFCLLTGSVDGRFETGAGVLQGKLNVHLVAHSHDDVGWLKTVDQYFIGSNNSIQVYTFFEFRKFRMCFFLLSIV